MLEAGLTHLCLVWSNSHCGVVTTLTLVSLVLWVITMTSTPLQLSWLVYWHGVGLLSLCFGWLIPKRVVVDPWSTGFTVFSLMVIYLSHYPIYWEGWGDYDEDWDFGWWLPQWHEVGSPRVVKKNGWYIYCKHTYQSINMFNFQHQPNTESSTNKEYKMLEKWVYWRSYLILICIPLSIFFIACLML